MNSVRPVIEAMIARYERRAPLGIEAQAALRALPFELKTYPAHSYMVREGERVTSAKLIVDGLAYRHKVTAEGARQIVSLHIAGEFIDLEGILLPRSDHNVQVLSTCTVAQIPREAVLDVIHGHGTIAHAMWVDTLIDASIYREWVVNVGRRDARQAMCHFLCEFGRRLEGAGLAGKSGYELPMTQEQLADTLGITPVHVNRVLRELDDEGVVIRHKRFIEVPNWEKLRKIGGFSDLYLHQELVAGIRSEASAKAPQYQ